MDIINKAIAWDFSFASPLPADQGKISIESMGGTIVTTMTTIAAILAVVYLIYSGILYLTAAGNPDAAKKGQQGIVNAVIGLVVILMTYYIIYGVIDLVQKGANGSSSTNSNSTHTTTTTTTEKPTPTAADDSPISPGTTTNPNGTDVSPDKANDLPPAESCIYDENFYV